MTLNQTAGVLLIVGALSLFWDVLQARAAQRPWTARALFGVAFLCMGLDSLLKAYGLMSSGILEFVVAMVVLAAAIRLRFERGL